MNAIDSDDIAKLIIFKSSIGLFAIVDYTTPNGLVPAMGRLESASDKGDIFIKHIYNGDISWYFNIEQVKSFKFSPIKEKEGGADGRE